MSVVVKKKRRIVPVGVVHIEATFNNTLVTVTDLQGDTIVQSSSGKNGFKGSKKSTPYAAQVAVEDAVKKARDEYGLKTVMVKVKGPGVGRDSGVRALMGFKDLTVTTIQDITPIPHNGCKPPKRRRV